MAEKLLSIPDHISNVHHFDQNKVYKACPHGPISDDREKAWLLNAVVSLKKLRVCFDKFLPSSAPTPIFIPLPLLLNLGQSKKSKHISQPNDEATQTTQPNLFEKFTIY